MSPPVAVAAPASLRLRTVAVLVAGRGGYRIAQYLTGLSFLALWGPDRFAAYAAATGAAGWLLALAASGIERAALIHISREGSRLEPLYAMAGLAPVAVASLAWGAIAVAGVWLPGRAGVYAAAAVLFAGVGAAGVLVALFRLRGRTHADPVTFTALSIGYLGGLGLVAWTGLGVAAVLSLLVIVTTIVNVALLAALVRARRRTAAAGAAHSAAHSTAGAVAAPGEGGWHWRFGRVELATAAGSSALLAFGDVAGMVGVAVLYGILDLRSTTGQISLFYVLVLVSSAASVLWGYLLRVFQPRALVFLDALGPARSVRRIRSLLVACAVGGGLATAAVAAIPAPVARVAAALLVEIVLFGLVGLAAYLVESLSGPGRARSAASAAVALAVTGLAGVALIPPAGAAGALLALCAGLCVRAAVLAVISTGGVR